MALMGERAMPEVKILVVEDNPMNMLLATELLKFAGYSPLQAETAEEAMKMVETDPPALILMDISLPGMDGLSATRILKKDPKTRNIPIVALTAHAMKGDEQKALDAGCDGYIAKPISVATFSSTIARHLK